MAGFLGGAATRLKFRGRQPERTGVTNGGPVAKSGGADAQPRACQCGAGLVGPWAAGGHPRQNNDGGHAARKRQDLQRLRDRLEVVELRAAGDDDQVGDTSCFQRRVLGPGRRIDDDDVNVVRRGRGDGARQAGGLHSEHKWGFCGAAGAPLAGGRLGIIMLHTTPADPAALAQRPDPAGPLAVATPTTRKLADASLSVNTRRAYAGALRRLDAWRGAAPVDDALLAVYLGTLFEAGRAPATAALAVAAVRFRAKLAGQPAPAGERTARVLGGYRRTAADRGRGQAAPLRADGLAAILATAARPRTDGRGVESPTTAHRRGRLDAVIAGLLFMGGLRRSEVAAVRWADVTDARDGDGVLLTVRTSKTNQEGDAADVRYLKTGRAKAIRTLRAAAADAAPTDRVIGLSPLQIQRRFTAAATPMPSRIVDDTGAVDRLYRSVASLLDREATTAVRAALMTCEVCGGLLIHYVPLETTEELLAVV